MAICAQLLVGGNFIPSLCRIIPTAGLGFSLFYKEISHRNEYFFFYNLGIGKIDLWLSSSLLTVLFCILLNKILQLCLHVWKLIVF